MAKDKRLLKLAASFFMKRIALVSIVVEVVAAMAALVLSVLEVMLVC